MSLEDIKEDVCKLKTDMIQVCIDIKWIKRIGTIIAVALVGLFFKLL
jgi:hypothetical protein